MAAIKFSRLRVRSFSGSEELVGKGKAVIYWMSRDQRVQDNWALIYAQRLASAKSSPLHVCFCLVPKFLDATIRRHLALFQLQPSVSDARSDFVSVNVDFVCEENP